MPDCGKPYALDYFEVDPVVVDMLPEIVVVDELLRNIGELDFDVLRPVKGGA